MIYLVRLDMRPEVKLEIIAGLQHLIAIPLHGGDVNNRSWCRHIFQFLSQESFQKIGPRRERKKGRIDGGHADSNEPRAISIKIMK